MPLNHITTSNRATMNDDDFIQLSCNELSRSTAITTTTTTRLMLRVNDAWPETFSSSRSFVTSFQVSRQAGRQVGVHL